MNKILTSSNHNKGLIIILSSPSGAGKSTLIQKLLMIDDKFRLSVSVTTRKARSNEVDGVNYFFKTNDEFKELINNNMLLEYDKIYNYYYGTPKSYIEEMLNQGLDVLFDINYQGVRNIKKNAENINILTIFIVPPSFEILEQRLRNRGTESKQMIELRMASAKSEMSHAKEYDHIIVNDDLNIALSEVYNIILKTRASN